VAEPDPDESPQLLTEEEIPDLERVGRVLRREAGHMFMREGEPSDFVLLIRKGLVKVVSGKPERIVAFRGPGAIVGELGVLQRKPRTASVVAFEDEVVALHVYDAEYRRFLDDHPRAKDALIIDLGNRLDEATKKIRDSDLAVERRLAKALAEQVALRPAIRNADGTATLRMPQKDLASLTGASVVAVKKAVKVFRDHGLIDSDGGTLHLRDIATLVDIAKGNPLTAG